MKKTLTLLCLSVGVCICLNGCVPHKQAYQQPNLPTAPAWHTGVAEQRQTQTTSVVSAAADTKWRDFYLDDKLRGVIALALKNNRDLRIAALNVEQAQAQYRLQRANLFPKVNATANTDSTHTPGETESTIIGYPVKSSTYTTYQVGGAVSSWELDFFGRLRSLTKQQQELYLASDLGRTNAQIALISSIASQFLAVGSDQDLLSLAQATLQSQKAAYDLARFSRDRGVKSDLDVSEALSQVQSAQVDVAKYSRQLNVDKNELEVLAGAPVPPDFLPNELLTDTALQDISAGLPSEVLLRRPDILEAEHNLKSAYANIAAARAAFFPQITLTSNAGTATAALTSLFGAGTAAWEFAPQLSLPIFDGGSRRANYTIAQVQRDSYVAEYEKAIQVAFQEVSDGLNGRVRLQEEEEAQQAEVKALAETYRLSEARYKGGIDTYLNVLDAQRALYAGQQSLINVRYSRLSNLVTLYKSLGGGTQ